MSYLKIFPRSISVKTEDVDSYIGLIHYDFERYGCMVYGANSPVQLCCRWQPRAEWFIRSTEQTHNLAGFVVFMNALNHYLFEVLQFDPISQWSKASNSGYELHLESVCFDLSTQDIRKIK